MKKKAKYLMIALEAVLLVMFVIPVFIGILNVGNIAGILISAASLWCTLQFNNIKLYFKGLCSTTPGKLITAFVIGVIAFAVVLMALGASGIMKAADNPPSGQTTLVVLGCKVNPSGPSRMLQLRIDAAYQFMKENPDVKCIVSGGQGKDEHISEAMCMYNELVAMGIDKSRIYIEDKSSNTRENIACSKAIIEREALPKDITIVTSDFHQYRATVIADDLGITSYNVPADTPATMFPTYFLREICGYAFELFF